jgi:hypothetical protein
MQMDGITPSLGIPGEKGADKCQVETERARWVWAP